MAVHEVNGMKYHISNKIKKFWDKNSLYHMKKTNSDRVYIVDGMERSGKSTFAFQQAGYLDPKMFKTPESFVSRICFEPSDFFDLVRNVKNGVIVFDEAFRGFSSRASISKINKKLNSALMEMGQNNNIVFLVLPRIFLLDIYPAMLRSNGLFNIKINKNSGKRIWRGFNYNDKNKIYQDGIKKGWKYPINTPFKDYFYSKFPGGEEYHKAYDQKKRKALEDLDKEESPKERWTKHINEKLFYMHFLYQKLKEHENMPQQELSELVKQKSGGKIQLSRQMLTYARKRLEEQGFTDNS